MPTLYGVATQTVALLETSGDRASPSSPAPTRRPFDDLVTVANEAFLLFGDRVTTDPAAWQPGDPHHDDLTAGDGRLLAELIA